MRKCELVLAVLACLACGPSPPVGPGAVDPRDKALVRARSADGLRWEALEGVLASGGSSPQLAGEDVLFVQDGEEMRVVGFDGGPSRPLGLPGVDPHRVAIPGGFRLYFVDHHGGDPGAGRENEVHSARSSDGRAWTREPGVRWRGVAVDPDVVRLPDGRWRMFRTVRAQEVRSAVSEDGLAFREEPGIRLQGGGVTSTLFHEGRWWMFFHRPTDNPPRIHVAWSEDGLTFVPQPQPLLEGESPSVEVDGQGWRMVYATSPSPPGAGPRTPPGDPGPGARSGGPGGPPPGPR